MICKGVDKRAKCKGIGRLPPGTLGKSLHCLTPLMMVYFWVGWEKDSQHLLKY